MTNVPRFMPYYVFLVLPVVWAGRQKKEGREKLVSVTRGRRDRNLFCEGELISYDIMLVMMEVTPL
jgi:hypothetical protein